MEQNESPKGSHYEARRATLEDLPGLRLLWQAGHLPVQELEKRFTEFQVIRNSQGEAVGAMGLRIEGGQGQIHSEAYANAADAAGLRALLWERVLRLAKNNGLVRLWTPATVSFYREKGMGEPDEATRGKIPPGFGSPGAEWLVLKLKEESQPQLSLEQELTLFAEHQKGEVERMQKQREMLKLFAYGFLLVVLGGLGALIYVVFIWLPRRRRRRQAP